MTKYRVTKKEDINVPEEANNVQLEKVEGKYVVVYTIPTVDWLDYIKDCFGLVEASQLSLKDDFIKNYEPTVSTKKFYNEAVSIIKEGIPDFYAQKLDPAVVNGEIHYEADKPPGVGQTPNWWRDTAPNFAPKFSSSLGTKKQRYAFYLVLIKKDKMTWEDAAVNSKDVAHCWDSPNPKHDFEDTGCRPVGDFCDLGNTCKITLEREQAFDLSLFYTYFDSVL